MTRSVTGRTGADQDESRSASEIWDEFARGHIDRDAGPRSTFREAVVLLRESVISYEQHAPLVALLMCRAAVESAGRSFLGHVEGPGAHLVPPPESAVAASEGDADAPEGEREDVDLIRTRLLRLRALDGTLIDAMARIRKNGERAAMIARERPAKINRFVPERPSRSAAIKTDDPESIRRSEEETMAFRNIRDTAGIIRQLEDALQKKGGTER
ncbi:MAG: hypothetical protein WA761_05860 [Thermoplasmata archaeon]